MSSYDEFDVPSHLVEAAIGAAEQSGKDVADVPLTTIAQVAGLSRSTLVRRLRGSRRALDEAVRAAGVDPGGWPVRVRAVEAGARLVSERGLAAVTLEAVAEAADCSVHSLHGIFGTRDELFAAIYKQYSPLKDLETLCSDPDASLEQTVASIHRTMAVSLTREPRVAPAMLADLLGNPDGPPARIFARYFPRALSSVGGWLATQVEAGRIRDIPMLLLVQQLMGPLATHLLLRPAMTSETGSELPELEQVCSEFTNAFLRAVAAPDGESGSGSMPHHPCNDAEGE